MDALEGETLLTILVAMFSHSCKRLVIFVRATPDSTRPEGFSRHTGDDDEIVALHSD